jgi:hypothetical protein
VADFLRSRGVKKKLDGIVVSNPDHIVGFVDVFATGASELALV